TSSKKEKNDVNSKTDNDIVNLSDNPSIPSEKELLLNKIKELESLVETLQSERREITSKLKTTEYDKASLEELIQELKDKQSYLIEQIKAEKEDKDSTLISNIENLQKQVESLIQEKTAILTTNQQFETTIEALKKEKQEIEDKIKKLIIEKEGLLNNFESEANQKDNKIAELQKSISLLQVELKEKQLIIERLTESNIEYKSYIDDLKRDHSKYKQNTLFAIISILVVVTIIIILLMNNKIQQKSTVSMQPKIEKTKESNELKQDNLLSQSNVPIPSQTNQANEEQKASQDKSSANVDNSTGDTRPTVNEVKNTKPSDQKENIISQRTAFDVKAKDFKVSLKPITKENISRLKIRTEKISKIDYSCSYLVTIRTKKHLINKDFKKSPNISFIYHGEDKYHPVKIVSFSYSKNKRNSGIKIQSIVITDREKKPVGIVIGPMNKDNLKIIII
ncbi:MAG: hypothetical protein N2738_02050, partial [Thermodesulfovibrionales bacterium]|nr:hypothetical protein [Thermodesulfovibrionales bacterium]